MHLPEPFIQETRKLLGDDRFQQLKVALDEEPPVSIRLNPFKVEYGKWRIKVEFKWELYHGVITVIT